MSAIKKNDVVRKQPRSGGDRRSRSRPASNGRRHGEDVVVDDQAKSVVYIATKADIARLEEQVKGLDRALAVRLEGIERLQEERSLALRNIQDMTTKAADKAESAQHNINIASNEFRNALDDAVQRQASRPELDSLDKRVQALERGVAGGSGRSAGFDSFKVNLFAILALLISLLTLFWRFKS